MGFLTQQIKEQEKISAEREIAQKNIMGEIEENFVKFLKKQLMIYGHIIDMEHLPKLFNSALKRIDEKLKDMYAKQYMEQKQKEQEIKK